MFNNLNLALQKFVYPTITSATPDQLQSLSDPLIYCVGKELSLPHFAILARVCKTWNAIIQPQLDNRLLEQVSFGRNEWLKIPGVFSVSEEVKLTDDQKKMLLEKLKSICIFFNEPNPVKPPSLQNSQNIKKIWDQICNFIKTNNKSDHKKINRTWETHKLIFFPEMINEKSRTVNSQDKLFHFTKANDDGSAFKMLRGREYYGDQAASESFWGLVMLDTAPGSQKIIIKKPEECFKSKGYDLLTPNDAVSSIFTINLGLINEKKDYFLGQGKLTVTSDYYANRAITLVLGHASSSGPFMGKSVGINAGMVGIMKIS